MDILHHKTFGQGPALIVLHGLFGSLDNWLTLGRAWAEHYSVYLVDQRNHGRSFHSDTWTYQAMAEDVHALMESEGILKAHLLGHSMGGKTVMQFAGMYPERIDRLMVADMGIRGYEPHHDEILQALAQVDLESVDSRQEADEQLAQGIAEPGIRQFLAKSLARMDGGFAWRFNLPVISQQYQQIIQAVTLPHPFEGPTLFLSGGKSHYVQPEDHAEILQAFPQAQFVEIPGAGHWLHAEAPDAFSQQVMQFLSQE
jgi:pimeloyl-ACP methyl ester carboxylesterase